MKRNLFAHRCENCGNSYLSYDKEKVFCSSTCEARYEYKGHGNKYLRLSEEERRYNILSDRQKQNKKNSLKRQAAPKKEKKIIDLKSIMFKDTFKPYVPKNLKVMRG